MTRSVIRIGKQVPLNNFDFFSPLFEYVDHVLCVQANFTILWVCVCVCVCVYVLFHIKPILLDHRIYTFSEVLKSYA